MKTKKQLFDLLKALKDIYRMPMKYCPISGVYSIYTCMNSFFLHSVSQSLSHALHYLFALQQFICHSSLQLIFLGNCFIYILFDLLTYNHTF